MPLFLYCWGAKLYGEWLLLFAVSAYFTLFDFGFTGVCEREMAILVSGGNRLEALNILRTTSLLLILISILLLIAVRLVLSELPIDSLLNLLEISNVDAAWVITFLAFHACLNFFSLLIYGCFYCEGRYGSGQFQLSLISLLEFICLVGVLALGFGPLYAAISYVTARLLGTLIMYFHLRNTIPWIIPGIGGIRIGIVKRLFMPSISASAFPLGNVLNVQGMRLVIGMVLGPPAVTIFTTLRTLTRLPLVFLRSLNTIIQPEMGYAYGTKDSALVRELHRRSFQVNLWGSLITVSGLAIIGKPILASWTGEKVPMDLSLFFLLLAGSVANVLWASSIMVSYATNRHKQLAIVFILINSFGLMAAYGCGSGFGLISIGLILFSMELLMLSFVIQRSIEMTEDSWPAFIRSVTHPPIFLFDIFKE